MSDRQGVAKRRDLFDWSVAAACGLGATQMIVDADMIFTVSWNLEFEETIRATAIVIASNAFTSGVV